MDFFGRKARLELAEIQKKLADTTCLYEQLHDKHLKAIKELEEVQAANCNLTVVNKIIQQQQELLNGSTWLQQVAAQINRHDTGEGIEALMMHELQQYLLEDELSDASQLNLNARPLFLVLDVGLDQTAIALVRGGIELFIEARGCIPIGGASFESALVVWMQKHFTVLINAVDKASFLPSAQRICSLLCQGAPFGNIEETIFIDGRPITVNLPLSREELAPVFLPLLGVDGSITISLKKLLSDKIQTLSSIDRIVCLGVFGRLPLLQESLAASFNCEVLLPKHLPTLMLANWFCEEWERKKRDLNEKEKLKREEMKKNIAKAICVKSNVPHNQAVSNKIQEMGKLVLEEFMMKDTASGLKWAQNGNIAGKQMTWHEARAWVNNLNYGGYRNWRLPTRRELLAFAKYGGGCPADHFNRIDFLNVQGDDYWSDSDYAYSCDSAWAVSMYDGHEDVYLKTKIRYVWPVRSGDS
jgi:hypothetical protein